MTRDTHKAAEQHELCCRQQQAMLGGSPPSAYAQQPMQQGHGHQFAGMPHAHGYGMPPEQQNQVRVGFSVGELRLLIRKCCTPDDW